MHQLLRLEAMRAIIKETERRLKLMETTTKKNRPKAAFALSLVGGIFDFRTGHSVSFAR